MTRTTSELVEIVRAEAGGPTTAAVSDGDIERALSYAVNEVGRYIPAWKIFKLTTEANVQAYSVDDSVLEVILCSWSQGSTEIEGIFGSEFRAVIGMEGGILDPELDIYKSFLANMTKWIAEGRRGWEWNEIERKIYLYPVPTESKSVYYIGRIAWTFQTLPNRYERPIVMFATAQVMKLWARRQRRETIISHQGVMTPYPYADPMLTDARQLEREFVEFMEAEGRKFILDVY